MTVSIVTIVRNLYQRIEIHVIDVVIVIIALLLNQKRKKLEAAQPMTMMSLEMMITVGTDNQ
jgi:hypothetical protein